MIQLRDVASADRDMLLSWRNQPDIAQHMYTDHHITASEHRAWFERVGGDHTRRYWVIVCDGTDVGLVNLYDINVRHQRCYWAFYVASADVRGKGIGSFVEYSILREVFDVRRLHKLCCEVLATNNAVIELHKSFGFTQEGCYREHVRKADARVDVVSLAMLRPQWEANRGRLAERLRNKGLLPVES